MHMETQRCTTRQGVPRPHRQALTTSSCCNTMGCSARENVSQAQRMCQAKRTLRVIVQHDAHAHGRSLAGGAGDAALSAQAPERRGRHGRHRRALGAHQLVDAAVHLHRVPCAASAGRCWPVQPGTTAVSGWLMLPCTSTVCPAPPALGSAGRCDQALLRSPAGQCCHAFPRAGCAAGRRRSQPRGLLRDTSMTCAHSPACSRSREEFCLCPGKGSSVNPPHGMRCLNQPTPHNMKCVS